MVGHPPVDSWVLQPGLDKQSCVGHPSSSGRSVGAVFARVAVWVAVEVWGRLPHMDLCALPALGMI